MIQYDRAELEEFAREQARFWNVPEAVLFAQIQAESNWNPYAVSPAGAKGIMQFMPATAEQYEITDPFDPYQEIQAGAHYMHDLMGMFGGDVRKALIAFNWGPGNLQRQGEGLKPQETKDYLSTIERLMGGGLSGGAGGELVADAGIILKPGESITLEV